MSHTPDDPCRDHDEAEQKLSALTRRPQRDFEIEFYERILCRDPDYVDVLVRLGELFAGKGCHRRALQVDRHLAELRPSDPLVHYNLACSLAVTGQTQAAFDTLRRAIDVGYKDFEHLAMDPDLETVRRHPDFPQLVSTLDVA